VPRRPRSIFPAAGVYHVTCRGVARCPISVDDTDRRRWRALLTASIRSQGWQCLVWCLMPNHFHLVVDCELEQLSKGMHGLNFRYAQTFNKRHERVGHLFQERFHTWLPGDEAHLSSTCSYVLDNPVRAQLCRTRHDWPWSGGLYA
jgi:REP element-mobilizing transposase RayT